MGRYIGLYRDILRYIGFKVLGLELRVYEGVRLGLGLWCRVQGFGFKLEGLRFRVEGLRF